MRKIRKQAIVPAVSVNDQDFLAAITGHLVSSFLQQGQLHAAAVRHRPGFVLRLSNLTKVVFGEDDRVLPLGGMECGIAHVEQVGAEREMRPVFFENSERKKTYSGRAVDAFTEIGGGEFLPVDRELRRCGLSVGVRQTQRQAQRCEHQHKQWNAGMDAHGRISLEGGF